MRKNSGNYHLQTKKPETSNVSSALRAYAGLEKEVVLAGVLDKIEIWDKKAWDAHSEEVEADIDDIASDMEDLGLSI